MDKALQMDAPLDLAHLERQTFGDDELARDLLRLFSQQADKLLPVIRDGADAAKRADAAHTLKGGARAVGAFACADAAERIERVLHREQDPSPELIDAAALQIRLALQFIAARDPDVPRA